MVLRNFIFGLLLAVCSLGAHAQTKADCKEMLVRYQQSMGRYGAPDGKHMLMAHLTITTIPSKDSPYTQVSLPNQNLEVRMIIGRGYLVYESPYLALYRDARECYTVIHPRRLVTQTALPPDKGPDTGQLPGPGQLATSMLLDHATVRSCRQDTLNARPVQVIELDCDTQAQQRYGILRMVYYFDAAHNRVVKQELEYVPGHPTSRQTIVYHQFVSNYKYKPQPAAAYLFSGNQLKEKFRGYTLEND